MLEDASTDERDGCMAIILTLVNYSSVFTVPENHAAKQINISKRCNTVIGYCQFQ